ncbi:MAG TPA: hypothetical protein VE153_09835 [Myxococcus sp.]|jgi:hypothetical protein|nr:hypothetical protein [Myxococcus sp.]
MSTTNVTRSAFRPTQAFHDVNPLPQGVSRDNRAPQADVRRLFLTDSFEAGPVKMARASGQRSLGGMPAGHLDSKNASEYGRTSVSRTTVRHGKIEISTTPINMRALTKQGLDAAVAKKNSDDVRAYGKSTAQLKADSQKAGYFDSTAHNAWAKAAEARTGGRIPASWWKQFDPYGGTAGNGPNILPTGKYPGALSRISMAHDTDWSLGRYFKAGPLKDLYGLKPQDKNQMEVMGMAGLRPMTNVVGNVDLYSDGRPDWNVKYH